MCRFWGPEFILDLLKQQLRENKSHNKVHLAAFDQITWSSSADGVRT